MQIIELIQLILIYVTSIQPAKEPVSNSPFFISQGGFNEWKKKKLELSA